MELEDADEVPWGIVHSHVASPAVPSATDVGLAFFPDSLYLVCSLADPERPTVRAWSIVDGDGHRGPVWRSPRTAGLLVLPLHAGQHPAIVAPVSSKFGPRTQRLHPNVWSMSRVNRH